MNHEIDKVYRNQIRKLTITDQSHADTFNPVFRQLLNNDEALREDVKMFHTVKSPELSLIYTRETPTVYKGITYDSNMPFYDDNGLVIDSSNTSVTFPNEIELSTDGGLLEIDFTVLSDQYTVFEAELSNGVFKLVSAPGNSLELIFGNSSYSLKTKPNIYTIGASLRVIVRWSKLTNLCEMWVNDEYIGIYYLGGDYSTVVSSSFTSQMALCTDGILVIRKLNYSTSARRVL